MSAKDEVLLINQTISEIDKRLFELKSKLNQILKQIPRDEEALAAIKIKIAFSKSTLKHMKTKTTDLVDILEFKQTKNALLDQLDSQAEASANLVSAKKTRQILSEMITKFEDERELKRLELNEYGQVRIFTPRNPSKVTDKGGGDGKST